MTSIRGLIPALLLLALTACRPSGGGDTVTIGFTGPLSGGAALYGRNVLDGLEMAVADINETGGLAIGDRKVTIAAAPLDDRYFPNESATNAKRLVHQYGAPVVFCPHSEGILAIQGFNATEPPFIVGACSSEPQILERGNPLTVIEGGFVVMDQAKFEEMNRIPGRAMELAGTATDARAIRARADEAAATLPDEYKPSELLGVDADGHLRQTTIAAHVVGGKFVPLRLASTN